MRLRLRDRGRHSMNRAAALAAWVMFAFLALVIVALLAVRS